MIFFYICHPNNHDLDFRRAEFFIGHINRLSENRNSKGGA